MDQNKTVTLSPDEADIAAEVLTMARNAWDRKVRCNDFNLAVDEQEERERVIGRVRTAESVLKKLGEK